MGEGFTDAMQEEWNDNEPIASPDIEDHDTTTNVDEEMYAQMREAALNVMYEQEFPNGDDIICCNGQCGVSACFTCHDCDIVGILCQDCFLKFHAFNPFHRASEWNGSFFEKCSLADLGAVLPMGHNGVPCPHVHTQGGPQTLVILDTNGIHEVQVGWCRCAGAPSASKQLFDKKLFLATMARPRTAFTFRALTLFHMLNHVSKATPWDFAGTMQRLTDNIDHHGVPDIYKMFKVVQRQWRISGQLAFPCVSCPVPGVNLDPDWKKEPDSSLIHTMFIGGDGNFRLRRKHKGGGEATDPSLFGDDSFYAPNEEYKGFCMVRGGAPDDIKGIICRQVKAGEAERLSRAPARANNGVILMSCLHTGVIFPNGAVDIPLGKGCESWNTKDSDKWPLMTEGQRKKLSRTVLVWLVPKFHLASHIENCADKFSFNWTTNVGRTSGESVETIWVDLNQLATATREMGYGHRKDTLKDAMSDHNYRKAVNEAEHVKKAFEKAVLIYQIRRKTLEDLEAALGEDTVATLRAENAVQGGSQYRPKEAREERTRGGSDDAKKPRRYARVTGSVGINMGLELEMRQQTLRDKIAEKRFNPIARQELQLDEERRKVAKALEAWYGSLAEFMPPEALQEELPSDRAPEKKKLRLPSDFDRSSHAALGLTSLADIEFRLRMGRGNDALKKLREALGLESFLVRKKYQLVGGQHALLRSETEISRAQKYVEKWAEVYRRAWDAMGRLAREGPDGNHGRGELEKLKGDDLVMLSQWMEEHRYWRERGELEEAAAAKQGKGRKDLPWIWKIEFDVEVTRNRVLEAVEKWTADAIRLEWVHAKASLA
ncbi:hypothetical protein M422DRAFT_271180 [Sphaerobolus stellatus SS14]|uniref:CxC2-like cysteine cluster KDZ transposase-associated domain-containing protein n=1 Tax=Sphaerobolus stellatus (strain SS14) TaxID=990650 RepID=A0A0C9U0W3_SPHS4|nr:hypothetical protein M422DRAFT_271180 [Sphaerobolus stellatus SS14]